VYLVLAEFGNMDGGGFRPQNQNSDRNKGVLPINSHILLSSKGNNSNAKYDRNGYEYRLGAVARILGTVEDYESKETHWTLKLNDYCLDSAAPVYVVISRKIKLLDSRMRHVTPTHRIIEVIGLLDDHLDYGRSLKGLCVREVISPFQWIGHLMEVALVLKLWNTQEGDDNRSPHFYQAQNQLKAKKADEINATVEKLISELGAQETCGCKRDDIYREVGTDIPKATVDAAIQWLSDEGKIYNTLDDDTFKSSDQ